MLEWPPEKAGHESHRGYMGLTGNRQDQEEPNKLHRTVECTAGYLAECSCKYASVVYRMPGLKSNGWHIYVHDIVMSHLGSVLFLLFNLSFLTATSTPK